MKTVHCLLLAALALPVTANAQTQMTDTRIGKLEFELGLPTEKTVTKLFDELDFQRAVQSYLWSLPIVGMESLARSIESNSGARPGEVGIFEGYRNVSAYFTADATTPYILGVIHLEKSGPTVLAVPPGLIGGSIVDMWQRATTDIGVTGPDKGSGAKFLLVGPGQQVPEAFGYVVVRSPTFHTIFFFRALDPDPAKANALKTGVQVYPFAQRDNPKPTRYVTATPDMPVTLMTPPSGLEYWKVLSKRSPTSPSRTATGSSWRCSRLSALKGASRSPPTSDRRNYSRRPLLSANPWPKPTRSTSDSPAPATARTRIGTT
jgi:hypothetical protein